MPKSVTLYLIHCMPRYGHAAHYLGVTTRTVRDRMEDHLTGRGNTLVRLFAEVKGVNGPESAVQALVVAEWAGTRGEERRLKNRGGLARICPVCRAAKGQRVYQPRVSRQGKAARPARVTSDPLTFALRIERGDN